MLKERKLWSVKLLHTLVWGFFVGCICVVPVLGAWGRFREAVVVVCIVLGECAVLGLNRVRCPMSDWAARYTSDRSPNFDIFLPRWLAEHNKIIFGILFVINTVVLYWQWRSAGR